METRIDPDSLADLLCHDTYTPEELALLLGMSLYRIRHAAREGDLRAAIVDHHVLCIRREDVVEWLTARE